MPFKDPKAKRKWQKAYLAAESKKLLSNPAARQALRIRKRREKARYDARQRARKARAANPQCSASEKATACIWRLHRLAPDGDLVSLRERIRLECRDLADIDRK